MQNEPNLKNPKRSLTPYPKNNYKKTTPLQPQKNKPKTNPIQPNPHVPHPSSLVSRLRPRPRKSASCLPPPIKKPIPTPSAFRNFALCLFSLLASRFIGFEFSLLTLSPKSVQSPAAANQLCAKTERNHHLFMQNEPNPKNTKTNLTPVVVKSYNNKPPRQTQENKPNSNPIKPNPPTRIKKTNPIQTQFPPPPNPPSIPITHTQNQTPPPAIRHPLHAAQTPPPPPAFTPSHLSCLSAFVATSSTEDSPPQRVAPSSCRTRHPDRPTSSRPPPHGPCPSQSARPHKSGSCPCGAGRCSLSQQSSP